MIEIYMQMGFSEKFLPVTKCNFLSRYKTPMNRKTLLCESDLSTATSLRKFLCASSSTRYNSLSTIISFVILWVTLNTWPKNPLPSNSPTDKTRVVHLYWYQNCWMDFLFFIPYRSLDHRHERCAILEYPHETISCATNRRIQPNLAHDFHLIAWTCSSIVLFDFADCLTRCCNSDWMLYFCTVAVFSYHKCTNWMEIVDSLEWHHFVNSVSYKFVQRGQSMMMMLVVHAPKEIDYNNYYNILECSTPVTLARCHSCITWVAEWIQSSLQILILIIGADHVQLSTVSHHCCSSSNH